MNLCTGGYYADGLFDRRVFVKYPSQAGAYFQWANNNLPRRAYHPLNPAGAISSWQQNYPTTYWNSLAASHEVCPSGYYRPNDGPTDSHTSVTGTSPSISEMRQSLWINPPEYQVSDISNSFYGYLADGFFDRGVIQSNRYVINSSVPARIGRLFHNPYNNASLFFAYTGHRYIIDGRFVDTNTGAYWNSSSYAAERGMSMGMTEAGSYSSSASKHYGLPIRCVKN